MTSLAQADTSGTSTTGHGRNDQRGSRRRDVQGLRAVAVLAVIAYHAGLPFPGGFAGVDVFFVISGYVITAMLVREIATHGRVRYLRFYIRRFKRLTPALALVLVVTLLGSALLLGPFGTQQVAAQTGLGAVLLVANFVIAATTGDYFDAPAEANPLLHTWSLSVEEQFYLFFPALLGLAWVGLQRRGSAQRAPRPQRALLAVVAVGVVSFVLAMAAAADVSLPGPDLLFGFYSPVTRAWEFAVGALIALLPLPRLLAHRSVATLVGALGLGAVVASMFVIDSGTLWPGPMTLLPVLGTAAAIVAGADPHGHDNVVTRLLSVRPAVAIGDWSYSLYLWHWPVIVAATMLWPGNVAAVFVAAVVSAVPAIASYHLLEEPIRQDSSLVGRRLGAAVAVATVPPMVLAAGLYAGGAREWWSPVVRQAVEAVAADHAGHARKCDQRIPLGQVGPECTWGAYLPGRPVYLLGDSNADHFSDGLIEAGRRLGRPVTVATTNACPFLDITFRDDRPTWSRQNAACGTYVQQSLADLTTAQRGTVVIANSDVYWDRSEFVIAAPGGRASADAGDKAVAFRQGLASTIARLRAAGHQVLVAQSTPKWAGAHPFSPQSCSTLSVLTGSCRAEMTVSEAEVEQGAVRTAVREVAAAAGTSAGVWDTWPELCPGGTCTSHDGARLRYRDPTHITVDQSLVLGDSLVGALESLSGR